MTKKKHSRLNSRKEKIAITYIHSNLKNLSLGVPQETRRIKKWMRVEIYEMSLK